jgi:hypothetical protein
MNGDVNMSIQKINSLISELEQKLLHTQGIINRYLIVQEIKSLNDQLESITEEYFIY